MESNYILSCTHTYGAENEEKNIKF